MEKKQYNMMNWEGIESIVYADCNKPFELLGVSKKGKNKLLQVFYPDAVKVTANFKVSGKNKALKLERVDDAGFFAQFFNFDFDSYTLNVEYENMVKEKIYDPYFFSVELDNAKVKDVIKGKSVNAYEVFGSHKKSYNNVEGYEFVVYAPNASSVSLVGDFNNWVESANLMENDSSIPGVYKIFMPGLKDKTQYKYVINSKGSKVYKNDPFSLGITGENSVCSDFKFSATKKKKKECPQDLDLQILEVDILELVEEAKDTDSFIKGLLERTAKYNYNAISFIHLFKTNSDDIYDIYNPYSLEFTDKFDADVLKTIVSTLLKNGVLSFIELPLAYVSKIEGGLADFDKSKLFENEDERLNFHSYYNAMLYDYTHPFTKSYLLSCVNYFLKEYDFNGYIMPNAGVIIYHDYNKNPGEYITEEWGNTLNTKGISFIKDVNRFIHKEYKNALCIASIYAYYKDVTGKGPDSLCFDYCFNTGACAEILDFLKYDPTFRRERLDSFLVFTHFTNNDERFIYPYSYKENKASGVSIYDLMPGDKFQKLSNLKMAVIFKHLLNGSQITNIDVDLLKNADKDVRDKYLTFLGEFKRVYESSKHRIRNFNDEKPFSYKCIDNQVITREYFDGDRDYIIVFNFSKDSYQKYTIPVTHEGVYKEVFNSDKTDFGGSGIINTKAIMTEENEERGIGDLTIKLPSLSIIAFEYRKFSEKELDMIFQKKKKAMIKYVEGEKKKVKDKLNKDIESLKDDANARIAELEKLLIPYQEKKSGSKK